MAVIWGIPNWVWLVVAGISFAACIVITRVLLIAFASVRELAESLELSARLMRSTLEATRDEVERAQHGLSRLSGGAEARREAWTDW